MQICIHVVGGVGTILEVAEGEWGQVETADTPLLESVWERRRDYDKTRENQGLMKDLLFLGWRGWGSYRLVWRL